MSRLLRREDRRALVEPDPQLIVRIAPTSLEARLSALLGGRAARLSRMRARHGLVPSQTLRA